MPAPNRQVVPRTPERRLLACLLSFSALLFLGCEGSSGGLRSLDGERLDTEGKILLVNYWAEWCAPCREEIPELNAFYQAHKDDVLVLGINFDQLPAEQVAEQARKFGIAFPLLASAPEGRWGQTVPQVLPSTFIIDASGQWQRTLVGPQTSASLADAVASVVKHP
ncbi:TlpA family protein disulfide reductase [Microbulbifer sp. CAU 1566]|uniref:TlpA family protein disulfide reductase n=1 Tax=Microbulbifer sp. CAU 1566 TaxID=2933269 RepID=UPI002006D479|nr:TlpA disulfide reductase family protein [Microbulbifer sp. CAU 1566]MCK7595757.1 TlpA family protein disulfide reductase [Microbulbifer sp. CAU 1566]